MLLYGDICCGLVRFFAVCYVEYFDLMEISREIMDISMDILDINSLVFLLSSQCIT